MLGNQQNGHSSSFPASRFPRAAPEFPLGFVASGEEFILVAVLGFETDRNLFVSPTGQWIAHYVPAAIRSYPFAQGRSPDGASTFLCVDEASGLLSDEVIIRPFVPGDQTAARALILAGLAEHFGWAD